MNHPDIGGFQRHSWQALGSRHDVNGHRYVQWKCRRCERNLLETANQARSRHSFAPGGQCHVPELGGEWMANGFRGIVTLVDRERLMFAIRNAEGVERAFDIGLPDECATTEAA